MRALWNEAVLAESDQTIVIDGNHYFPPDSIVKDHFKPSDKRSVCGWKGEAEYYDLVVAGKVNKDAAWYYPQALPDAKKFEGYVAFWNGVEVVD